MKTIQIQVRHKTGTQREILCAELDGEESDPSEIGVASALVVGIKVVAEEIAGMGGDYQSVACEDPHSELARRIKSRFQMD